jgi:uncharacterized protein
MSLSLAGIRTLASVLVSRAELATRAGKSFDGKRNLYEALGYKLNPDITDYRHRFRRNGVAARVIEAFPKATWRGGGEIIEDPNPEKITPFEQAWLDIAKRLKIWRCFIKADILAGFGRHSTILIGAPGPLSSNLPLLRSPDDIAYIKPYAEDRLKIDKIDEEPRSARYGLPLTYKMEVQRISSTGRREETIHWSRCIHVCDDLEDDIFGPPRLERVWNLLDDLEKVTGGGAEAFWMRANQGYQFDLDKEIELPPEKEKQLEEEVEAFVHGIQRVVRTRGVKVDTLGSDVANFAAPALGIIAQISASTGIPQRILMGSERGELASTQDRDNWFDQIADRREQFATPNVIEPLVQRLIDCRALPEPETWTVVWSQLKSLDDGQRLDLATKAATVNKYQGSPVITPNEIRDKYLGIQPMSDEDLALEMEKLRLKASISHREGPAGGEKEDDEEESGAAA